MQREGKAVCLRVCLCVCLCVSVVYKEREVVCLGSGECRKRCLNKDFSEKQVYDLLKRNSLY